MAKKYIDIYLVGQVMGDHLAEYCKTKNIDIVDVVEKINDNKAQEQFILGLLDSLGWSGCMN